MEKLLHTFAVKCWSYDKALSDARVNANVWIRHREKEDGTPLTIFDVIMVHVRTELSLVDGEPKFVFEIRLK